METRPWGGGTPRRDGLLICDPLRTWNQSTFQENKEEYNGWNNSHIPEGLKAQIAE